MFKSFILIFKQKTPQVHKFQLKLLLETFFPCIVKHKNIKGLTGSKLKKFNIKNELHKMKDFASNEKLTRNLRRENNADRVKEFQMYVKGAFINAASCMEERFPLVIKFLVFLTGLDPKTMGYSATHSCVKKLDDFYSAILTSSEKN